MVIYMELQPLELSLQALIQPDASPILPHHGAPAAEAFQCPFVPCSPGQHQPEATSFPFGTRVPALEVELKKNSFITNTSKVKYLPVLRVGFFQPVDPGPVGSWCFAISKTSLLFFFFQPFHQLCYFSW